MKRALAWLMVCGLGAAALPDLAGACQCDEPRPLCQQLWEDDDRLVVLEGTVESIEPAGVDEYRTRLVAARLGQVRSWRRAPAASVVTPAIGAACGYPFEVGERYLIAGWRNLNGQVETYTCSLTRPVAHAGDMLRYLEGLSRPGPGGSIRGRVVEGTRQLDGEAPLAGVEVRLEGPVERAGVTDAEGRFSFESLPPGSYVLQVKATLRPDLASPRATRIRLPNLHACHESRLELPIVKRRRESPEE